ncbi:MAG: hypothetical protein JWR75_1618 [Devosia sp.]|nr:hypothetical protein [Devosia sp.]
MTCIRSRMTHYDGNVTLGSSMLAQAGKSGASLSLVHNADRPISAAPVRALPVVSFDRKELTLILNVYGKKVAAGEWRDYAMDFLRDRAMFSIFARHSEKPLFFIEKNPRLARKQGQYAVVNQQGRILKRGQALDAVLRVLDPDLILVS